ncbi:apd-3 [Pristionchus pacificus]|uniref:AP-3 complex subunit delta n=1 Tax=Pristionchus pacificus TaxID=54126 RepID=A0A2A6CZ23_PRIPA|nr:apd-3 [Pristionchus pacificus]|eukprot:PDM83307.1 apd-3 [Pristionchus pacificus]
MSDSSPPCGACTMALRKVRTNLDRLFDKSLTDLIRGIRNNKDNEARYIAACIDEIKQELRQDSSYVKANAIEKLCYLQMLGYDISWASFNIIEVMASTKYTEKRVGYLAAAQSFHESTDVLMLTTNLIRKDLTSASVYDSGVALAGLACFVTPDLARDLSPDIVNLLTSSRPYTRKRAVLMLYKIFLKYPEALRPTFPRLKERLEDPDPGVQSAAVNVICELARKNPKNYLTLAPVFFKLMTTSSNNWMLIKIIKLFGALVPLEKRLGNKLLEPLTNLINSTSAMSLLYECINTVIAVLISVSANTPGDQTASIQLCVQKLGVLIEDSDQNLKYLGLLAMGKILQTHPKAVQAHKDIVLRCLDDKDESIRLRSLDLLYGMVSKKNIMEIVRKLMDHVESAEGSHYRDELLSRIISICSYNNYSYITNFEWYISVLVELTKVEGTKHGAKIAEQIQDVTVRVESIRHFSVSQMALLVENAQLLLNGTVSQRSNISEVLLAAAWICGEYSEHVSNIPSVLEAMLKAKVGSMPGHILAVYVQNMAKLYTALLVKAEQDNDWDAIDSLDNLMLSKLPAFELAEHLEAQERACTLSALIKIVESVHQKREKIGEELSILFEGELNPVAPKAQRKVPVPEGLDLDAWIGEEWPETEEEEEEEGGDVVQMFGLPSSRSMGEFRNGHHSSEEESEEDTKKGKKKKSSKKSSHSEEPSKEELERRKKARQAQIESNPYYVKGSATTPVQDISTVTAAAKRPKTIVSSSSASEVEKAKEAIQSPLEIPGVVGLSRYMEQQEGTLSWKSAKKEKEKKKGGRAKKGKKNRTVSSSSEEEAPIVHLVNRDAGEMPEDAKSTDGEGDENGVTDEFKALDIDLDDINLAPPKYPQRASPSAYSYSYNNERGSHHERMDYGRGMGNVSRQPKTVDGEGKKKKTKKSTSSDTKEKKEKGGKKKKTVKEEEKEGSLLDLDGWGDNKPPEVIEPPKEKKGGKKKKEGKSLKKRAGEYEEASGVCTPSSGPGGDGPSVSPMTEQREKMLACNQSVAVELLSAECAPSLVCTLRLRNIGQAKIVRAEISIADGPSMRIDSEHSNLSTTEELASMASSPLSVAFEGQPEVDSYRMRGTLVYSIEEGDSSREEQLKVLLPVNSFAFLQAASLSTDAYSMLLTSGRVECTSPESVHSSLPFKTALALILAASKFGVIEEEATAASLYSSTVYNQPICLLVKKNTDVISLCVKAEDQSVTDAIVGDLRQLLSRHSH